MELTTEQKQQLSALRAKAKKTLKSVNKNHIINMLIDLNKIPVPTPNHIEPKELKKFLKPLLKKETKSKLIDLFLHFQLITNHNESLQKEQSND